MLSNLDKLIEAFNKLNLDDLINDFENHCFYPDTIAFDKDLDIPEVHNFESKKLAEEFCAARCAKFEILASDLTNPRLFNCSCSETGSCEAFLEWYEDCNDAFVNFRHDGHAPNIGQSRLNKFHVALIRVFSKFFWRHNKSNLWNVQNICFCFKMVYSQKNALHYLTVYDFERLGLYELDAHEHACHYELNETELALKAKYFTTVPFEGGRCMKNMKPWRCREYTPEEWADVDDDIWIDRDDLREQPETVISGKAYLMAKHFLEFANTLLLMLQISSSVFEKEQEVGMAAHGYMDLSGIWPVVDLKKKDKSKRISKGIYLFLKEDAMRIYGKRAMPAIIEIMFHSKTISEHLLPNPNDGELGSKFRDYLVQMRAYLKAIHYNGPITRMLLLNGENKIAYMDCLRDFEDCVGLKTDDKFKRREYVRWDDKKGKHILEKNRDMPVNIWTTIRVPSNGSVSSRLYWLTGIPIRRNLKLLERRDKKEQVSQTISSGATSKKPTATVQFVLEQDTDDDEYKSADDGTGRNTSATVVDNENKKAKKTRSKKNKNKK